MNRCILRISSALIPLFLLSACSKDKFNTVLQPGGTLIASNSSIRLFNFYNIDLDVTINNIQLTAYGQTNGTQAGLSIFPSGIWKDMDNGNPFSIPNGLVTKDGKVHMQLSPAAGTPAYLQGAAGILNVDTILIDDPLHPKDYYALYTGQLLVIPRNPETPTHPDHFKIRVINLGSSMDPDNLTGPAGLTYSDGAPVDPMLSNVPAGGVSPYVELPYGAYMFKLFNNNDFSRQLTELPALPNLNICAFPNPAPVPEEGLFPRVRTFKPGATYSIVITQNFKTFPACNGFTSPIQASFNGYRIITEQSPGPNTIYARMDAVNALPVKPLSVLVDGQQLGGLLPYAEHTDYGIYVQGVHQVQAIDGSGNVLVQKSITLSPYDNYTAWVYENPSGKPDICFANTDMTSSLYQTDSKGNVFTGQQGVYPPVDDGTNGSIRVARALYAWQTRFLNLSPDLPFATFTDDASTFPMVYNSFGGFGGWGDSLNFASASINLAPGMTPDYDPFVIFTYQCAFKTDGSPYSGFSQYPTSFPPPVTRVFSSSPGPPPVVPGTFVGRVAPLFSSTYIANPALYPTAGYMPACEPGIYTTALIGRTYTSASDEDKARLIILKHNK